MPLDAQGDVRRGRPSKVPRAEVTMSEALETARACGPSSSSDATQVAAPAETTRKRELPHEPDDDADWTKVGVRLRFRTKTPDQSSVKRAKAVLETSIPTDMVVDELTSAETTARKRASLADMESEDDKPASKR